MDMGPVQGDPQVVSYHMTNPIQRPQVGGETEPPCSLEKKTDKAFSVPVGQLLRSAGGGAMLQGWPPSGLIGLPPLEYRLARDPYASGHLRLMHSLGQKSKAIISSLLQAHKISLRGLGHHNIQSYREKGEMSTYI